MPVIDVDARGAEGRQNAFGLAAVVEHGPNVPVTENSSM